MSDGCTFCSHYTSSLLIHDREWQHLVMLKRGGRGNNGARRVAEMMLGELAVMCPACPQPGVNLPEDWGCSGNLKGDFFANII
ncbi:hypothetical protein B0H11DRAFT_1759639 [Mycena galericulata]|nr:hypothetical protein B0H11DRAFT_1759639 [Mycena galericulata]